MNGLRSCDMYTQWNTTQPQEKNEIMPFAATWMELEIFILSEVRKRKTNTWNDITYTWNLKYGTNEPIYKTETDSQTWRTDLWLPRGREEGVGWTGSLGLVDANYYIQNG